MAWPGELDVVFSRYGSRLPPQLGLASLCLLVQNLRHAGVTQRQSGARMSTLGSQLASGGGNGVYSAGRACR